MTSQSAETASSTANNEGAKKKKKKKNKKVSVQNGEASTKPTEVEKILTTSSPGKFVKAVDKPQQTKSPSNQKSNKRKFNDDDKKSSPGQQNAKKMKFNKNGNKKFNNKEPSTELSENRLKAFGINPKKFKNKIKYGGGGQNNKNNNQNGPKNHKNVKPFQKKKMSS